mmetsp:Transcript_32389/g.48088  ORF Transcript_32389/g.48088 Transcript_32389/m.48088 type:complete len:284 (+) Transcript_32389:121-972(+)
MWSTNRFPLWVQGVVASWATLLLAPHDVVSQTCSAGTVTPADQEGPFFIAGSPVSDRIAPENELAVTSDVLYVEGTVYGNDCVPMDTVLLEPWYAGAGLGDYSEEGGDLEYRGQIFTDSCGRYSYTQTFPISYPGRPIRHVHFIVSTQDGSSRLLTTQMYFKDDPTNSFIKTDLQMRELVTNGDGSRSILFDMYLNTPGTGDVSACAAGSAPPTATPETPTSSSPVSEVVGKPSASPVDIPPSGSPVQAQNNPTSTANLVLTAASGFAHLLSVSCLAIAFLFL